MQLVMLRKKKKPRKCLSLYSVLENLTFWLLQSAHIGHSFQKCYINVSRENISQYQQEPFLNICLCGARA